MENNSILLDIKTFDHKVHNRTKGRLRLYLGEFQNGNFIITIDTIKNLAEEEQVKIKGYLKSVAPF